MIVINGSTGLTLPNGNVITSATVSANSGTAALPNYTGTDTDTGMWFPDVNAVAISTAGVERLRIDSSGNVTGLTLQSENVSPYSGRNRIINGAMVIDQRNAGASVTPTDGQYSVDRWKTSLNVASKFSLQQSTTAPAGFINSLLATSLSSYSIGAGEVTGVQQLVEGLNVADLAWGTASAATVTLSFWVRSSLTGTFGGSLRNSAANRSYPFSYTISSANTWEQKSVTIAGDTSGTWLTTNGIGIQLYFSLGAGSTFSSTAGSWQSGNYISTTGAVSVVGTNGATFYITGVQLEKGTVATPFEFRSFGQELLLCQRYFEKSYDTTTAVGTATRVGTVDWNFANMGTYGVVNIFYRATKRSSATVTNYDPDVANTVGLRYWNGSAEVQGTGSRDGWYGSQNSSRWALGSTSQSNAVFHWTASAEL